jgi:hypothetical protein
VEKLMTKKQEEKRKVFLDRYIKYEEKIRPVIQFLKENHSLVEGFHVEGTKKLFQPCMSCKEKLHFIFVDSINAAGGNNLTASGESCEKFYKKLKHLPNEKLIDFKIFAESLNPENPSLEGVFRVLAGKEFKNIGFKKAALFIRALYVLHTDGRKELFKNFNVKQKELYIPLDIVIAEIMNRLIRFNNADKKRIIPWSDFNAFNQFAKEIFKEDFMILEDFWYWGYFNTKKEDGIRVLCFNKAKFYCSSFNYPDENLIGNHEKFVELVKKAIK